MEREKQKSGKYWEDNPGFLKRIFLLIGLLIILMKDFFRSAEGEGRENGD